MRYTLSFAALMAVATAQLTYEDLPACSLPSVNKAITDAGCTIGNEQCICANINTIAPSAEPGVIADCKDVKDQEQVVNVMRNICGITDVPGGAPAEEVGTATQYSASSCLPVASMPSGYIPRPASSDAYAAPPIVTDTCTPGSPVITITSTRVVSLVTQSSSGYLSVSSSLDLSSLVPDVPSATEEPYEPYPTEEPSDTSALEAPYWPTTSVTGVIELSTFMPPQASYGASSTVSSESSNAGDLSSIAAPQVPYPSAITSSAGPASSAVTSSVNRTDSYTSKLPEFTNAAEAVRVPAVVAGVVGMAAWIL